MPTQEEILQGFSSMFGPVRTAQRSLNGTLPREALNKVVYSQKSVKTRRSRKMYHGGNHSKVANWLPMEASINRPHSARFGSAKQFTKKAPRRNVNAAYRNQVANVLPTEESSMKGVQASRNAIQSRLRKLYPTRENYRGGRRLKRTRKSTRKHRR